MEGKYRTVGSYWKAWGSRVVLRGLLRTVYGWGKMREVVPGYTLLIACHAPVAEILRANLRFLGRQNLKNMDRVLIAMDGPASARLKELEGTLRREHPELKVEFLYQSAWQAKVLKKIGWGWVDCWLSYCKGIGAARTKYVMLHDVDAFLLEEGFVEERFEKIQREGAQFVGTDYYWVNGFERGDEVLYIVEMMLDAEFLRGRFVPVDLFNRVGMVNGRSVDFDILLYPQLAGKRVMMSAGEKVIHPSQVISQLTYLKNKTGYVPPEANNLLLLPYFLYLSGLPETMEDLTRQLAGLQGTKVELFGRTMDLVKLSGQHAEWLMVIAEKLERFSAGGMREDVRRYFEGLRGFVEARAAVAA